MGYRCTNHPDQPAVLLITNLDTGDAVELCGPCVHPWASAIASATDPAGVPEHDGDDDGQADDDTPVPYVPAEPEPAGVPGPLDDDDDGTHEGEEGAWALTDHGLTEEQITAAEAEAASAEQTTATPA